MKKDKKKIITLAVIALILLVTFGVSVAVFSSFQNGDIESSIQVGDLTFHYTEMSGLGNGINIEDGEQLSDSEGKVLDTYFDFRIESNLVNSDLEYEVSVEPTNNSNMPLAGVKFYLTELKNSSEIELNSNFNGLNEIKTLDEYDNLVVYRERIVKNTKNYEKNFRARMWIAEDIDVDTTEYMGATGSFKINVNARSTFEMIDASVPVPEITGGTGDTWVSQNQTIRLKRSSASMGGIEGYEYYVTDDENDVPTDATVATGMTDNEIPITSNSKHYVYYRTVVNSDKKSAWSNPQVVYKDSSVPTAFAITATDSKASGAWHTAAYTLNLSATKTGPSNLTYYYGTTNNPTTQGNSITVNTNSATTDGTTYYAKVCNESNVCSDVISYQAKLDTTTPTVSINPNIPKLMPVGSSYTVLNSSSTNGVSGGSTSCTANNTSTLAKGVRTVTCTATTGAGKSASASLTLAVVKTSYYLNTKDTVIATYTGSIRYFRKSNTTPALAGLYQTVTSENWTGPILVSPYPEGANYYVNGNHVQGDCGSSSFNYLGMTWYVSNRAAFIKSVYNSYFTTNYAKMLDAYRATDVAAKRLIDLSIN